MFSIELHCAYLLENGVESFLVFEREQKPVFENVRIEVLDHFWMVF
jgi:hypothetical protein